MNRNRGLCVAFGIVALLFIMAAFAGCNTTEGVGEDIESAGESIQDAAD